MIFCKSCQKTKSSDCFYESSKTRCKECVKIAVKKNRAENIDRYREYDRLRGNRQSYEYVKSYRNANKKKYAAHNKVNNALRDGKIQKGCCEICGSKETHAHHDDYDKPMDVRWLCAVHHKQWHMVNGEGANAC